MGIGGRAAGAWVQMAGSCAGGGGVVYNWVFIIQFNISELLRNILLPWCYHIYRNVEP